MCTFSFHVPNGRWYFLKQIEANDAEVRYTALLICGLRGPGQVPEIVELVISPPFAPYSHEDPEIPTGITPGHLGVQLRSL